MADEQFNAQSAYLALQSHLLKCNSPPVLPSPTTVSSTLASLPQSLPSNGLGARKTHEHMLSLLPSLPASALSSHYYGAVTGGSLPIAEAADNIVSAVDQNVQVYQPTQPVAFAVEERAVALLVELLRLGDGWNGIFTTGATSSNVLGLACGREAVLGKKLQEIGEERGVADLGILEACLRCRCRGVRVVTSLGHSSLFKAASVVGIGRACVLDAGCASEPSRLDEGKLEKLLREANEEDMVSVVVISAGEVNTGRFATDGMEMMRRVRRLCDEFGAWLHIDGAFGLFARCLPQTDEFQGLINFAAGLELADSITGDCHKLMNVPYDSGIFLTRSLHVSMSVFQNPNAAYLSTSTSTTDASITSPLHLGLENSRRWRALPVYGVLLSLGREGLEEIFARQVRLARRVAEWLHNREGYILLPQDQRRESHRDVHIVVLFRARDEPLNLALAEKINISRRIYVSSTVWEKRPACRIAVSSWMVDVDRDLNVITTVLDEVLRERS